MQKTAIVTGASRGIGRAVAERLARGGWAVCVNYRERRDMAESLCTALTEAGCAAMPFQADVSDRTAVDAMAAAVRERFGAISLLVSNAGIAGQMQFQDVKDSDWNRFFDVNVRGAYHAIQAVLPDMLHAHAGSIVTVSSMWGLHGASCETVYSATKAALIGLTRSLAMELAPTGIRVNCVAPGVVDTDMVRTLGEDTLRDLAQATPLGRLGTPEDIAAAVEFLAGDGAGFITGQVLTADGGFVL
ncbi:MAG: 3-oxoacyl-ACP reductase FabG [Oscillospiraceae bacterium]|nr:3-oxoacyl-ACP reductase FabG [Oscillospiraceae bacterium]